jgi:hypothetical protein
MIHNSAPILRLIATMTMWTAEEFAREAQALVTAFDSLQQRPPKTLNRWKLEQQSQCYCAGFPNGQRLYLTHPAVNQRTSANASATLDSSAVLIKEESFLEDESVESDDPNIFLESEPNGKNDDEKELLVETEWQFSIVYSDTWQVPVLYFLVQRGGSICSRTQVVDLLAELHPPNQECVDDPWDFVSFEEHPISGIPSCFLHPCQTSARLDLLNDRSPTSTEKEVDKQSNSCSLLSWMSMILPAVGFGIPPHMYQQLLAELTKENGST